MKSYKEYIQEAIHDPDWKKGDGQPKGATPLKYKHISHWDMSDSELKKTIVELKANIKKNPDRFSSAKESPESIADAEAVLAWRKKHKIKVA